MKTLLTSIIIVLSITSFQNPLAAKSGKKYLFPELFPVENSISEIASNKILIISTRNFINPETLSLEKGVHPENKRFFFVAGTIGDSTIITNYQTLEDAISHLDQSKNMLVYVNGYNKTFDGTVKGGQMLSERYSVNAIMFDWPTEQKPIRLTAKNARKVSNSLTISLIEIEHLSQNCFPESKLSLIFHSMGNHVARHLVNSGNIELLDENTVDNIILNAAAVKSHDHDGWVEKLKHKEDVYIVVNKYDYVLRGASLMRGVRQLGNVALGELADNANYINFSNIADKEHSYYMGTTAEKINPEIFEFYSTVFQGTSFNEKITTNIF